MQQFECGFYLKQATVVFAHRIVLYSADLVAFQEQLEAAWRLEHKHQLTKPEKEVQRPRSISFPESTLDCPRYV